MPDGTIARPAKSGNDSGKTFIIAEIGANHSRNYKKALMLLRAAELAGADAIKVQMFTPDELTLDSDAPEFRITDGPWSGQTLYQLYQKAAMPLDWVPNLRQVAEEMGLTLVASVYSPAMVKTAVDYGVEILKVSSFEQGYSDLIQAVAESGLPAIVSCGASTTEQIQTCVDVFKAESATLALLRCVSQYPAPIEQMNLMTMADMKTRFGVPVGLSDHSLGCVAAVLSVALGGTIIEKHIKLPNDDGCLDAAFSADPRQFRVMVETIRQAERALGVVDYTPTTGRYVRKKIGDRWIRTVT